MNKQAQWMPLDEDYDIVFLSKESGIALWLKL